VSIQDPVYAAEGGVASLAGRGLSLRVPAALRAQLALTGLLATTLAIVLAAAATPQLLPQTTRPAPSWLSDPLGATGLRLGAGPLIALLVVMFGCYVVAARSAPGLSPRLLIGGILAIYALVLLAPPLFSTDVFSYQAYGRMGALHGLNPYLAGPHAAAHDPVFNYVGFRWRDTPTVYGPLFTALAYVLAPLSIAAGALAYKGMAVVAMLLSLRLVWKIALARGIEPRRAVALVGLNPLLFLYGAGGGHNDLLMLLPLLAGIYLALGRRPMAAGSAMLAAAAVKLTGGLPLAFALAAGGRRESGARRRMLCGAALAGVALTALGVALFGGGLLRLPGTLQHVQSQTGGHSLPDLIVKAVGAPGAHAVVGTLLGAAAGGSCLWLLGRVWQGRLDWIAAAGWSAVALLVATSWLVPWYMAWVLPLAALGRDRRLWQASIAMSAVILAVNLADYVPHT